jgi:hypothetical protein
MEGGPYEHDHRMVATRRILLLDCLFFVSLEPRCWLARLGLIALGAVILQGVGEWRGAMLPSQQLARLQLFFRPRWRSHY